MPHFLFFVLEYITKTGRFFLVEFLFLGGRMSLCKMVVLASIWSIWLDYNRKSLRRGALDSSTCLLSVHSISIFEVPIFLMVNSWGPYMSVGRLQVLLFFFMMFLHGFLSVAPCTFIFTVVDSFGLPFTNKKEKSSINLKARCESSLLYLKYHNFQLQLLLLKF